MTIFTIGHSTLSSADFLRLLEQHSIRLLADVRQYPASRRYPHFNKELLQASLDHAGIGYEHMRELGGRRAARKDSHNTAWRSAQFRGYADYMETPEFQTAIDRLITLAQETTTAYMCAEALWWKCHRSLISDYLKAGGHTVVHILSSGKSEEHPYTSAAHLVGGKLSYEPLPDDQQDLFS